MRRPIVLIGLPGAGKSTVAPLVARLLDSSWCDLDSAVAAQAGKPIADIFAEHGEAYFRVLERAALAEALVAPPQVIAAGAGWAAQNGNVTDVAGRALIIYMSLPPPEAAARLAGANDRPLLAGDDPAGRIAELLAARERWYRLADIEIDVAEGSPNAVAEGIVVAAKHYGGW
jgi:shikimate kinase